MASNMLLPLQGGNKKPTQIPRSLPWAIGRLAFQAAILAICLSSCAPAVMKNITKQLPPLEEDAEVVVYEMGDTVPEHAEIIGGISFSQNTDWENLLNVAKKEARAAGGNGLEIQLRVNSSPSDDISLIHLTPGLSAFILNVNDSIPSFQSTGFDKNDFRDYVVTQKGDTIHCLIEYESKKYLQFVHGYNSKGYRKTIISPKDYYLSYHLEDPTAFAKRDNSGKKQFNGRFAVDGGYSISIPRGFVGCCDVRYNMKYGFTIGTHYNYFYRDYFRNDGSQYFSHTTHFFAVSLGHLSILSPVSSQQILNHQLGGTYDNRPESNKHRLFTNIMLGYIYYREELDQNSGGPGSYVHTGRSFGIGGCFGYDYMITKHIGIGATCEFVLIKKYSNHLDFTAGIRYYL